MKRGNVLFCPIEGCHCLPGVEKYRHVPLAPNQPKSAKRAEPTTPAPKPNRGPWLPHPAWKGGHRHRSQWRVI